MNALTNTFNDAYEADADENAQKDMYLSFSLGKEEYGVDIIQVSEVVGLQKITKVPDMPAYVIGVINLRGRVIPLIDVRMRFQMAPRGYDDRTCVVVVNTGDNVIGLVVDQVKDVLHIPLHDIEAPPNMGTSKQNHFINGMGKIGNDIKILLDLKTVLEVDVSNALPLHHN